MLLIISIVLALLADTAMELNGSKDSKIDPFMETNNLLLRAGFTKLQLTDLIETARKVLLSFNVRNSNVKHILKQLVDLEKIDVKGNWDKCEPEQINLMRSIHKSMVDYSENDPYMVGKPLNVVIIDLEHMFAQYCFKIFVHRIRFGDTYLHFEPETQIVIKKLGTLLVGTTDRKLNHSLGVLKRAAEAPKGSELVGFDASGIKIWARLFSDLHLIKGEVYCGKRICKESIKSLYEQTILDTCKQIKYNPKATDYPGRAIEVARSVPLSNSMVPIQANYAARLEEMSSVAACYQVCMALERLRTSDVIAQISQYFEKNESMK